MGSGILILWLEKHFTARADICCNTGWSRKETVAIAFWPYDELWDETSCPMSLTARTTWRWLCAKNKTLIMKPLELQINLQIFSIWEFGMYHRDRVPLRSMFARVRHLSFGTTFILISSRHLRDFYCTFIDLHRPRKKQINSIYPVSYTHLTLPTKRIV